MTPRPVDAEFDRYQDSYGDEVGDSISFIGQEHQFFTESKVHQLLDLVRRRLGDPKQIGALDVGCGVGETDRFLESELGRLAGVDIAEGMIEAAARNNPSVDYRVYDGSVLPFEDDAFDLSFAICVFHHVPAESREQLVAEMSRVTRPGGLVAIFEHNPFNPLTRLAVFRCEFDKDAVLLRKSESARLLSSQGLAVRENRYIIFFPFRRRLTAALERRLTWLGLGAQYYVAAETLR